MAEQTELIAVAYSFLSYAFRTLRDKLLQVYLFGSVARGDFDDDSDIDIFFSTEKKNEKTAEQMIKLALKKYYSSQEYKNWMLKGIKNELKPIVGYLPEWKLKSSLEKEGIALYSATPQAALKKEFLITFNPLQNPAKRMKTTRKLYGRKEKGYKDKGIIGKYSGRAISPTAFMIPAEGMHEATKFLAKEQIQFKMKEIWT